MQIYQILFILIVSSSLFTACGGSQSGSSDFKELPEICRGYDFASDPEMADACGIRQTRYKSYKNLPSQRFLIYPKDANIVLTGSGVELRLANTHPVKLEGNLEDDLDFSNEAQLVKIKNKYIYKEIFPKDAPRIRMFKMVIPTKSSEAKYCFQLPQKTKTDRRKRVRMGNVIKPFECSEFDALVAANP